MFFVIKRIKLIFFKKFWYFNKLVLLLFGQFLRCYICQHNFSSKITSIFPKSVLIKCSIKMCSTVITFFFFVPKIFFCFVCSNTEPRSYSFLWVRINSHKLIIFRVVLRLCCTNMYVKFARKDCFFFKWLNERHSRNWVKIIDSYLFKADSYKYLNNLFGWYTRVTIFVGSLMSENRWLAVDKNWATLHLKFVFFGLFQKKCSSFSVR